MQLERITFYDIIWAQNSTIFEEISTSILFNHMSQEQQPHLMFLKPICIGASLISKQEFWINHYVFAFILWSCHIFIHTYHLILKIAIWGMGAICNLHSIDDHYLNGFIKIKIEQICYKNYFLCSLNMRCICLPGQLKL